jgi:hypothetical protein
VGLSSRCSALLTLVGVTVLLADPGCKGVGHGRVLSFTRPPMPAGFVEQVGAGWRLAVPSTWTNETQPLPDGVWVSIDPQAVDDYHTNVSVVREPFAGESYDYAKAAELSIHHDSRATVERSRNDVVDGDSTFVVEARWAPIPPASVVYRSMQTDLASRGSGYVVTCSAAATAFERYRSTCDSILRSFAIER